MAEPTTFIKLDRNIVNWRWFKDHNTYKLFTYLLIVANLTDKPWKDIIVKRGQIVTSTKHLSEETGLTARSVRTSLERLKSTQEVTSLSSPQYTVITINNYDAYQKVTRLATNERQTNDKRTTTTKESKESKEYKEERTSPVGSENSFRCATFLTERVQERIPNKVISKKTISDWSAEIERIHSIDGQEWDDIAAVLDFSQQSEFWQKVILSGKKFREKFDQLYLQMKQEDT